MVADCESRLPSCKPEPRVQSSVQASDNHVLNELLARAQNDEADATNELCRILLVRLRPILQSRLWGWPAADLEDILQNTLLVFVEKLKQVSDNPQYVALAILRNKIGDALRNARKTPDVRLSATDATDTDGSDQTEDWSITLTDPESDFAERIGSRQALERLRAAIFRLPNFCRTFFTAMLENRTIMEVWELFQECEPGLKRSAFDKRIFDCRQRLRRMIGE
jgi:DNA-directed RNA polymerase specialized sigma24 family protein